jgi:thiamine monophosphate kinase
MIRLYRLFGKDYQQKHRDIWVYSEHRPTSTSLTTAEDLQRTSSSFPSKASHATTGRPSVVGNVSDILAKQGRISSSETQSSRRRTPSQEAA